jgi:hypothetical protein
MAMNKKLLSIVLSFVITLAACPAEGCGRGKDTPGQTSSAQTLPPNQQAPATTPATPTPDELYQLVAPIALFPDNLVAQVLAASTYPDQITAAHTWLQQNSSLKGDQLMQTVDKQSWDNSVKALTQFPDVLNQMATNLSWTSALGDAYFNFPKDVMNAVQVMRQRAQSAGNLKSNQQQTVSVQNEAPGAGAAPAQAGTTAPQTIIVQPPPQTIIVQPAQPQVVYVPSYNPAVVYGAPIAVYPGYIAPPPPSTGALVATGLISFGIGMAVGAAMSNSCCGWGWSSWGCGWHSSTVVYNRNVYVSHSNTFVNRNNYYNRNNVNVNNVNRNNINTNNVNRNNYRANNFDSNARSSNFSTPNFGTKYNQPQFRNTNGSELANNRQGAGNQANFNQQNRGAVSQNRPENLQQNRGNFDQNRQQNYQQRQPSRGYEQQANRGTNTGAFSNYSPGGNARTNSARGQQSLAGRGGGSGGRRR